MKNVRLLAQLVFQGRTWRGLGLKSDYPPLHQWLRENKLYPWTEWMGH